VGFPFLLPGQGVNFRRPERKFFLAWQLPSVSLPTMQRYEYFMPLQIICQKTAVFSPYFAPNFADEIKESEVDNWTWTTGHFAVFTSAEKIIILIYNIHIIYKY